MQHGVIITEITEVQNDTVPAHHIPPAQPAKVWDPATRQAPKLPDFKLPDQ